MLRLRGFPIGVAVAAALVMGGCTPMLKDARFRSIELVPVSQPEIETVADLQVTGARKIIGTAQGVIVGNDPVKKQNLYTEAVEAAIASDPSLPDVLVAPSYFETIEDKVNVTVTVIGYPARYRNFRRNENFARSKSPFSAKQLPGGSTVISYDKNAFTAELAGNQIIAIQAAESNNNMIPGSANAAPVMPAPAAPVAVPPATPVTEHTEE